MLQFKTPRGTLKVSPFAPAAARTLGKMLSPGLELQKSHILGTAVTAAERVQFLHVCPSDLLCALLPAFLPPACSQTQALLLTSLPPRLVLMGAHGFRGSYEKGNIKIRFCSWPLKACDGEELGRNCDELSPGS